MGGVEGWRSPEQEEPGGNPEASQDGSPWWRWRREEPWWRKDQQHQGADWRRLSRWSWRPSRRRAGAKLRIRRALVELKTKAEAGIRKTAAVPEQLRMKVEPEGRRKEGRRSLTEPEEWNDEVVDGRRLTKAETEGRGSPVELVGWWATVETGELGA